MERRVRTVVGFGWAVLPLLSLGLATAPVFVYPVIRRHRTADRVALAGYLALTVVLFFFLDLFANPVTDALLFIGWLMLWLGGTVHALVIRSRVFPDPYRRALETVAERRALRESARETALDPAMAWELRIGRPDLARGFDDGGLVDVNHAPPHVLVSLPGMTRELVERIVRARQEAGGFTSVEELSSLAQLPPGLTAPLDEYAIFLP